MPGCEDTWQGTVYFLRRLSPMPEVSLSLSNETEYLITFLLAMTLYSLHLRLEIENTFYSEIFTEY